MNTFNILKKKIKKMHVVEYVRMANILGLSMSNIGFSFGGFV